MARLKHPRDRNTLATEVDRFGVLTMESIEQRRGVDREIDRGIESCDAMPVGGEERYPLGEEVVSAEVGQSSAREGQAMELVTLLDTSKAGGVIVGLRRVVVPNPRLTGGAEIKALVLKPQRGRSGGRVLDRVSGGEVVAKDLKGGGIDSKGHGVSSNG